MFRSVIRRIKDWFVYAYWVLHRTAKIFREDRVYFQANALAYRSLVSLVPMLAFLFSFFALFRSMLGVDDTFIETKVKNFISQFLMPQSEAGDLIINEVLTFVQNAKAGTYIGFLLLIVTSIFLFNAIERSFNLVWKVEQHRSLSQRFIIFTAILIWSPILLGLSIYTTAKIQAQGIIFRITSSPITQDIPISEFLSHTMDNMHNIGNVVIPYFLVLIILMILYMAIPNTKVELWAAFVGAAFAALCWELSKWGFGYFAKSMLVTREKIYGALAVFLVFLIWMYLISAIVLFGSQLSYVIQYYRHNLRTDARSLRPVSNVYLACWAVLNIAHRYLKGEELPNISELAAKFSVSIPQMRSVVQQITDAKILVRISGEDKGALKELYEPNRELDQITLGQVIEATASDAFSKPNHKAIKSHKIRGKNRERDPFDEQCQTYLDELFTKVNSKTQEILNQLTLRELILKEIHETDIQLSK
ncbi:MAG: YihY family inner membrane protein [Deltaproteobacteria bacterium]|nr:MAG: YihY family inner membrane protein [Deltaproteobacteria bacterium]